MVARPVAVPARMAAKPDDAALATHLASVACAVPPHRYDQETLLSAAQQLWGEHHFNLERVEQMFHAVMVGERNLALPLDGYRKLHTFGEFNRAFSEAGAEVGERAVRQALRQAHLEPCDVDAFIFATVTGVMTPSLDAYLANRLGLRPDVKRIPIFGLGCAAGTAGVARMYDYLRAWPDQVAILLCVELCSLTLQQGDLSVANLVAQGLFGDGAAAVVGVGHERGRAMGLDGPRVLCTRSRFYPHTEDVMGWEVGEWGFKVVLSSAVPQVISSNVKRDVEEFLAAAGVVTGDVTSWVCHPGGPKVIGAFREALGLSERDVELSCRSLQEVGNLSSASVLFVLRDTIEKRRPAPGSLGVMAAMGPGFHSEMVLLQW